MNQLEKNLDYQFKNHELLARALHHRSVKGQSNERLEFIGDSILGFVMATELFQRYPDFREGKLSRLRAGLVREETLAALAEDLRVGEFLYLGSGERKSGGSHRASILSDALEAIIGAIYLDAGVEICREKILAWFDNKFAELAAVSEKDSKTILQEYLQAKKLPLPKYEITATKGMAHEQVFLIKCSVDGLKIVTQGRGSSRQKAEQDAAQKFLAQVEHE